MRHAFATLAITTLATLASSSTTTPARADWTATDNGWTGCAQTGGRRVPTLAVGSGSNAFTIGCGAADRDGDYPLRASLPPPTTGDVLEWGTLPGAAETLALSPEGTRWVVTADGTIYRGPVGGSGPPTWTEMPGCATAIGVGAGDVPWIIGCDHVGVGGNSIQVWNGQSWNRVPGAAAQIAVAPEGTPWVLTVGGAIYRWNGSAFDQLRGCARSISVGAASAAWVIGCEDLPDGGTVYRFDAGTWEDYPGQHGVRIAIAPHSTTPWVADVQGKLHVWSDATASMFSSNGHVYVQGSGWGTPTVSLAISRLGRRLIMTTPTLLDGTFLTTLDPLSMTCSGDPPFSDYIDVWNGLSAVSPAFSCP